MSQFEVIFPGNKKVDVKVDDFTIKTDQSPLGGGEGTAPEPFTIFLASIAACAGIYAKVFCDRRGISTENMKLTQDITFDRQRGLINTIFLKLYVDESFPDKYKSAIINSV